MNNSCFVGVDVGTGSARAALVNEKGKVLRSKVLEIQTWKSPDGIYYEQSTDDIWTTCCECVKSVVSGVNPADVKGIGFDATCSLACVDQKGAPLTVSLSRRNEQNVVLWMDHRAEKETTEINALNHPVSKYTGGKISLEMETPKLAWLKRNLRAECYDQAGRFFDLPDFLTWRSTGCDSRSSCSLVCKWTYEMPVDGEPSWNQSYFEQIGLGDLQKDNWIKIGSTVQSPGTPVGKGLSERAANEMGLHPGTPVGTSLIDAHAGALGLIGCQVEGIDSDFHTRFALICGTSTCHMIVTRDPHFVQGVWGPYKNAVVPGMWLCEGGQSATGSLIDHVINSHPATAGIKAKLDQNQMHITQYLNSVLTGLAAKKNLKSIAYLTRDLHVYPDFHGNRSPIADPSLRGMISGLTLAADEENLALLYLATLQALSYGTRHILETLTTAGCTIKSTLICGGLSKNTVFTETQADVCNLPVVCPDEIESVLLGAAMLGAYAANHFENIEETIRSMGGRGRAVSPNADVVEYHNKKYKVFLEMHRHQLEYRDLMA